MNGIHVDLDLCAIKTSVVRYKVDRADLEQFAKLNYCLAHGQVGGILDDGVARPKSTKIFKQPVCRTKRTRAGKVAQRQDVR